MLTREGVSDPGHTDRDVISADDGRRHNPKALNSDLRIIRKNFEACLVQIVISVCWYCLGSDE